jgi:hypothetical protein
MEWLRGIQLFKNVTLTLRVGRVIALIFKKNQKHSTNQSMYAQPDPKFLGIHKGNRRCHMIMPVQS